MNMPKKQILRGFSLGFFIILGLLFQSCSGQKEAAPPQVSSENRELALQYFLAGSMADQKGEDAKAVLSDSGRKASLEGERDARP